MTRTRHPDAGGKWTLPLLALLVVPGLAVARVAAAWSWVGVTVLAAGPSLLAFVVYWVDKRQAETGGWRVTETMLHLLAAIGGWPGAFAAQRLLRHKTAKLGFQGVFWATVLTHEIVALDYLLDWPMARAFVGAIVG